MLKSCILEIRDKPAFSDKINIPHGSQFHYTNNSAFRQHKIMRKLERRKTKCQTNRLSPSSSRKMKITTSKKDSSKTDLFRRERTHNLIEKGAILESIFIEVKSMDAEETKAFLQRLKDAGNP